MKTPHPPTTDRSFQLDAWARHAAAVNGFGGAAAQDAAPTEAGSASAKAVAQAGGSMPILPVPVSAWRKAAAWMRVAVLAVFALSGSANAGLILAAGDVTPVFSLTDTFPNDATTGNRQFFANVLGSGTNVLVQATFASPYAGSEIDEFYDAMPGVTSTLLDAGAEITGADLAGADLFLAPLPDAFSAAEIDAIRTFVRSGGSIFLIGEGTLLATGAIVNTLLHGIGSSLSLGAIDFDDGAQTATGPEIVGNALTSGVLSFNYGATLLVSGGNPLFLTNDQQPFVAVESAAPVAEPATLVLFGLAVALAVVASAATASRQPPDRVSAALGTRVARA